MLRILRIIVALILFLGITLYFVDFAGFLPVDFSWLERVQFVPALKAHCWPIIISILVVTLLFGRIYCSTLCPLGVLQDIISAVAKRIHSKKKFEFKKPIPFMRMVVLIAFLAGFMFLIGSLFDPYSIFGRIACNVFKPIYQFGNNIYVNICGMMGIKEVGGYPISVVKVAPLSIVAMWTALGFLVVIGYLAWRNGRTYCNTICPVGAFLGLLSRFSFFRVRIDKSKCISCGLCAKQCKASCIDSKGKVVDSSRCVDCFDCLGACHKDAIHFQLRVASCELREEEKREARSENVLPHESANDSTPINTDDRSANLATRNSQLATDSRREFVGSLIGITTIAAVSHVKLSEAKAEGENTTPQNDNTQSRNSQLATRNSSVPEGEDPEMFLTGKTPYVRQTPIAPPGAVSIDHLNEHCTACHLCVAKCPTEILKPATSEYGVRGFLQPHLDFSRGFCNYDCTVCADVCPNDAIRPLTMEQKHKTQMGRVVFIKENCVVFVKENSCGACSEHCPTKAVTMVPYKGSLTIPQVNPDICVGCGGCESICPVRPFRAIYVEGNAVQHDREEFEEQKPTVTEVDDFGF